MSTSNSQEVKSTCMSVLKKLEDFHQKSGSRTSILFTKRHLNLPGRVAKNPDSPTFWYQCLLGRVAQMWLNHSEKIFESSLGKRKPMGQAVIYDGADKLLHFRHLVPMNYDAFRGIEQLPWGIPICLLSTQRSCLPEEREDRNKENVCPKNNRQFSGHWKNTNTSKTGKPTHILFVLSNRLLTTYS